jgi:NADH-quinone oxidoreductase subunit N
LFPEQLNNKLSQLTNSFSGFMPEIVTTLLFLLIIFIDLILSQRFKHFLPFICLTGFLIIGYFIYRQWLPAVPDVLFLNMLRLDGLAVFAKGILVLSALCTVLLSIGSNGKRHLQKGIESGEYFALLAAMLLGLHLMVMAANLLIVYLSIELVSICSYILATFNNDKRSTEGGLKYLLFGAMSSGVMLYGMSLLYGFTGSLSFYESAFLKALMDVPRLPLLLAVFLTLGGLLFKIAAVPFHIWTPDVYQAAPTPIIAFFSVAPKTAAFTVLLRFFSFHPSLFQSAPDIGNLVVAIAILTLVAGNFSALWQTQAKRMLAYSSIAHSGFILMAIVSVNELGHQSALFYLATYLFMNFAAFLLIEELYKQVLSENIQDYKGLGITNPFLGVAFLVIMIALTGLPPTAGFSAKLFVFSALWQAYQSNENSWLLVLFITGIFNIVVSLFYYLRIPFFMFFRIPTEPISLNLGIYSKCLIIILLIPLFLLFFKADWLMNILASIKY